MSSLSIASYNIHGFNTDKSTVIDKIVANHTFVLLQEHWLHENQIHLLNSIPGTSNTGVSGMPSGELLSGRPYGGCAILWKNTFNGKVEPVRFNSTRLCGVIISANYLSSPILLTSVYMPADTLYDKNNSDEYSSILSEITSLSNDLNISSVIIGGDFNTDFDRVNSLHTKELNLLCTNFEYVPWINCVPNSVDFTFESKIDSSKSLIDHFILSKTLAEQVVVVAALHSGDNLSDHSAISIKLDINTEHTTAPQRQIQPKVIWDKATDSDINNYKTNLDAKLKTLGNYDSCFNCNDLNCSNNNHNKSIDEITTNLIEYTIEAAFDTLPTSQSNERPKGKCIPGWKENIEPLKQDTLFWHSLWRSCGSPQHGFIAFNRRRSRALYHRAIKKCRKERESIIANKIVSAHVAKDITLILEIS